MAGPRHPQILASTRGLPYFIDLRSVNTAVTIPTTDLWRLRDELALEERRQELREHGWTLTSPGPVWAASRDIHGGGTGYESALSFNSLLTRVQLRNKTYDKPRRPKPPANPLAVLTVEEGE